MELELAPAVLGGSLVLIRIASMVLTAPVLGHRSVPFRIKMMLAVVLTSVAFPLLDQSNSTPQTTEQWLPAFFSELTIGIFLGLGVQIVFAAAQMTGTVISQMAAIQIGDGTDAMGASGSPVSKLCGILSIAAFILLSGPEHLIAVTLNTFVAVPVGTPLPTEGLLAMTVELLRQSFLLTLRGVAPAVVAMTISTFVIGLVSRNYPQINLLGLGLTTNLGVMWLALLLTLGGAVWLFADDFQQIMADIQNTLATAADRANFSDNADFSHAPFRSAGST